MTTPKYDTKYFYDDKNRRIKMPVAVRVGDKKLSPVDGALVIKRDEKYNVDKLKELAQQRLAIFKDQYETV